MKVKKAHPKRNFLPCSSDRHFVRKASRSKRVWFIAEGQGRAVDGNSVYRIHILLSEASNLQKRQTIVYY